MSLYKMDELREKIKECQSESRYEHTIGVMYTAAALAMCHQEDMEKAMVAGLLHDCAKSICPGVQHARFGAQVAKKEYGITDEDILNAIACHTTGKPNMTPLDKIIYIADYIEPNRKEAPNLEEIRHLAYTDLDACLYRILEDTLTYLRTKDTDIDPMTEKTYLHYKKLMNK